MHKFLDKGEPIYASPGQLEVVRPSEVNQGGSLVYTVGGNGFHTDSSPEEVVALIAEHKENIFRDIAANVAKYER